MLRRRLTAALRHKAARGELRQHLPVGLDYDDDGQVVLSADEAVRAAIGQVHALFSRPGSARQVMMTLREQELRLPRRKARARRITWAEASYPAVHDFLTNPAYAGAFVFRPHPHRKTRGRRRESDQQGAAAAPGPVGSNHPRSPPGYLGSRAHPWPGSGAQLRLQRPGWLRPHCAVVAACGQCDGRPLRNRGLGM